MSVLWSFSPSLTFPGNAENSKQNSLAFEDEELTTAVILWKPQRAEHPPTKHLFAIVDPIPFPEAVAPCL